MNKLFLLNGPAVTVREVTLVSLERRENPKVQTKLVIRTNQSIFCPQGGGQPSDIGTIESTDGKVLADVLFAGISSGSGDVELYCNAAASVATAFASVEGGVAESNLELLEGILAAGGVVVLKVDVKRRATNCILHSAGHLIDTAVSRLGLTANLKPGKGYHFPDGPNVEYEVLAEGASTCALLSDLDALTASISEIFRSLVTESVPTDISFESRADAATKLNETLEGR